MWPGGGRGGRSKDPTSDVPVLRSYYLHDSIVDMAMESGPRPRLPGSGRTRSLLPLARRLLGSRGRDDEVTCIACGTSLARSEAREYDKRGDRWDREDKRFEYLCKPCHRQLNHQPRDELEALLVELDAGEHDREAFLEWYCHLVEERYGPLEEER